MKIKYLLAGVLVIAVALVGATIWLALRPYTFRGSVIDPPLRAPAIALTTHTGKPFRLSDQTGNVVVIFFGYASCPDICPTTLYEFKKIRAQLGTAAAHVRFVLITIDPERDTPEQMRDYLSNFDPTFIGLTGTEAELTPVWQGYGVFRAKRTNTNNATNYLFDHSGRVYVVDARGNLKTTYPPGTSVEDMAADVQYLAREPQ